MEDLFCNSINWYLFITSIFLVLLLKAMIDELWMKPRKIEKEFAKQGIKGPNYEFFWGNLKQLSRLNVEEAYAQSTHDIIPTVLSFYHHWKNLYGPMFVVWFGSAARLTISDPTIIKEIFYLKSEHFEKIEPPHLVKRIEGDGLLNLNGAKWAYHRKIMQPIFHTQYLKLIVGMMGEMMEEALEEKMWNMDEVGIEVEVSIWFKNLVGKVITRATFGRSYEDGSQIFQLQAQLMARATQVYSKFHIPGYRFLPTSQSIISRRLGKEIRKSLLKVIDHHRRGNAESDESPTSFLELMMAMTENDIVEECKTIFFAAMHTTSNLLTWTTVLLAMHRQWQEQPREEVVRVCGSRDIPTKEQLASLKLLGMVIKESLRLYPPVIAILRRAKSAVRLTGVNIPRGVELLIPIIAVHHDPAQWGDDAQEFNPMRFAAVTAQAATFFPFGLGSRRCIGSNLAVVQAKLAIAVILQRFSFELAPSYKHAPTVEMILEPRHGAPIKFRKL